MLLPLRLNVYPPGGKGAPLTLDYRGYFQFQRYAEPVLFGDLAPEATSLDRYYTPLQLPIVLFRQPSQRPRVYAYPWFFYETAEALTPEVVEADKWFVPFSQPESLVRSPFPKHRRYTYPFKVEQSADDMDDPGVRADYYSTCLTFGPMPTDGIEGMVAY